MPISLRKSTAKASAKLLKYVAAAFFFFPVLLNAQDQSNPSKSFSNFSLGLGNIYGGMGTNTEIGNGHLAGYASIGYAPKRVTDTITLNSSFNYQIGARYYFNVGSDVLFPRIGLGYGWVTNYYNDQIGNLKYTQNVQGINMHFGTQVYSPDGFVFSFDINIASKYAISKANDHPYFYEIYIRPNVGIGYDLTRVFSKSKNKRHIKNKAINPFE